MRKVNLAAVFKLDHSATSLYVYGPAFDIVGKVSTHFILFAIMLNANWLLDYMDWLKLMRKAKKKGTYRLIKDDCFRNNEREFKNRVNNFAADPQKWGINVIKGDK